jgi:hypothetical protein
VLALAGVTVVGDRRNPAGWNTNSDVASSSTAVICCANEKGLMAEPQVLIADRYRLLHRVGSGGMGHGLG